jgi:uncharacterized protein (DUF1501 family)
MKSRRTFLKQSALTAAGTLLVPNFLKALETQATNSFTSGKTLVVIQLSGGNDGLNTVIPFRNDLYYKYRPQLAIAGQKVIRASDELGFHPALDKLNDLYQRGYLTVINNVGYPNPDRSHFRSMDIWQSASDSNQYLSTGWIGRYLDSSCNGCSVGHHAIEIDDTLGLALKGESIKGMAMKNPAKLYKMMQSPFIRKLNAENPHDRIQDPSLHYLYKTLAETASSADYIYDRSNARKQTTSLYPAGELAARLKTVASLIAAGVETKVFYVSFSGFDTHARQAGQHERQLSTYADSVHAFVTDLIRSNRFNDVTIMTFSEFGRRVSENASGGTDHGTANNLFLIGKNLKRTGFLNETPDLRKLDNGDLLHTMDFRSVYATLLRQWLGADENKILSGKFQQLDFI